MEQQSEEERTVVMEEIGDCILQTLEKAINPQWSNGNIGWDEPPSTGEDLVHYIEERLRSWKGIDETECSTAKQEGCRKCD